jgi:general secretion pathway protein G
LPTTEQGLQALVTRPDTDPKPSEWHQYMPSIPVDPWHHPYLYENPGKHNPNTYDLYSAGPDGKAGTDDDIGNWAQK